MSDVAVGAHDLVRAMHELAETYDLDSMRVGVKVPDGHTVFVGISKNGPLTLEDEAGNSMAVNDFRL